MTKKKPRRKQMESEVVELHEVKNRRITQEELGEFGAMGALMCPRCKKAPMVKLEPSQHSDRTEWYCRPCHFSLRTWGAA